MCSVARVAKHLQIYELCKIIKILIVQKVGRDFLVCLIIVYMDFVIWQTVITLRISQFVVDSRESQDWVLR